MRKTWNDYFADVTELISERATCERLHVGAVIIKDNRIIASGYNGSPAHMPHCYDVGCDVVDGHCIATIHAELNAILQCAKHGISTNGAEIYVTHFPCYNCAKAIVQAGIKTVRYLNKYNNDERVNFLFEEAEITCQKVR